MPLTASGTSWLTKRRFAAVNSPSANRPTAFVLDVEREPQAPAGHIVDAAGARARRLSSVGGDREHAYAAALERRSARILRVRRDHPVGERDERDDDERRGARTIEVRDERILMTPTRSRGNARISTGPPQHPEADPKEREAGPEQVIPDDVAELLGLEVRDRDAVDRLQRKDEVRGVARRPRSTCRGRAAVRRPRRSSSGARGGGRVCAPWRR